MFPAQRFTLITNKDTTRRGSPSPQPPESCCQLSNSCECLLQTATVSSLCTAYKQIPGLQLRWVLTQTHCPVLSLCTVHMVSMPGAGSPACHFILFSLAACSSGDSAFFLLCITCLGTPAHFQHTHCLVTQHTKSSSLIETVLGCIDTGCKLCTRKLAAGSDLKFVYLTALCLLARKDQSFI